LADLEANWETRREAAVAADVDAVRDPAPPRTTLGAARERLDHTNGMRQALVDEARHRDADPQARAELDTARIQIRAEVEAAAAQRARDEAEQQRQIHHRLPRPDYGPRPDNGHSRGFSP
jgi:hypothetical protein